MVGKVYGSAFARLDTLPLPPNPGLRRWGGLQLTSFLTELGWTFGNANKLILSTEGARALISAWAPPISHPISVLSQLESVVSSESVVSTTSATLSGTGSPFAAVEVADSVIVFRPKTRAKNVGMRACSLTA